MLGQNFMREEGHDLWIGIKEPDDSISAILDVKPWPAGRTKKEST